MSENNNTTNTKEKQYRHLKKRGQLMLKKYTLNYNNSIRWFILSWYRLNKNIRIIGWWWSGMSNGTTVPTWATVAAEA